MDNYKELLENNKNWADEQARSNPDYFKKLAAGQSPRAFWIGCSDSRVPESIVTGMGPGDIFVQRNVANQVVHDDINLLAALQYAVQNLEVEHVIVCGHYGCGGVKAAMSDAELGLINKWLLHIKDVYLAHSDELEKISDMDKRADRLVELNVLQQVDNLIRTEIIQGSWKMRKAPKVHGWAFGLADGKIKELTTVEPDISNVPEIYRYNLG